MPAAEQHPDLTSEQSYLNRVYASFDAMVEKARSENLADSAADKHSGKHLYEANREQLEMLEGLDDKDLCRGRSDHESGETLYIGVRAIHDGDGPPLVINWLTDRAKPFRRGNAEDRMGLTAKRTFTVDDRRLRGISEEVYVAKDDEEAEAPPEWSDALLEELERSRTPEMGNIIATIQAEQDDVMTHPLDDVLVIQGGPGTGKTAIGLHRASWLLFHNAERLSRDRVLVIGPNRAFMDYVRRVLPSLGEIQVDQVAIDRLTKLRPTMEDPVDVQRLKGDLRMAEVIAAEVRRRVSPPEAEVHVSTLEARYSADAETVGAIVESEFEASRPYMASRMNFRDRLADTLARSTGTSESTSLSVAERIRQISNSNDFHNAAERIWPTITGRRLVHGLLTGPRRLAQAASGILTEQETASLRRTEVQLEQATWSKSDVPLVAEADWIVQGASDAYGHVIVDEAQDLTPMQVRMIGRRARRNSLTILGDLAQATGAWPWREWQEVAAAITGAPEPSVRPLTIGYRVPRQVLEVAERVRRAAGIEVPQTRGIRDGAEPEFTSLARADMPASIVGIAATLSVDRGLVGIIAPPNVHDEIQDAATGIDLDIAQVASDGLGASVSLLAPSEAKGLEFDHVVLVEPADIAASDQGLPLLYVALTRCTKSLTVIHARPLPTPMLEEGPALGKDATPEDTPTPSTPPPVSKRKEHLAQLDELRHTLEGVQRELQRLRDDLAREDGP